MKRPNVRILKFYLAWRDAGSNEQGMTETCTYLRLKVRRSSLALSRSPTENVALPRKVLCRPRQKKQRWLTMGEVDLFIYPSTFIYHMNYRRNPSDFIFVKCVITEEQWQVTYKYRLSFSASLLPSVSPFSQLWQHVFAAGMMWTGGVSAQELGHGEWGKGRAHQ